MDVSKSESSGFFITCIITGSVKVPEPPPLAIHKSIEVILLHIAGIVKDWPYLLEAAEIKWILPESKDWLIKSLPK